MDPRAFVPETTRVVIGVGDFTGLIAAHRLGKAGVDVHVLESQPRVEDRVNTAYYPGGAQGELGV